MFNALNKAVEHCWYLGYQEQLTDAAVLLWQQCGWSCWNTLSALMMASEGVVVVGGLEESDGP